MAFKNTQGKKIFPFQMNLNWKLGGQEIEFASIFDTLYTFVNTYILKRKRSSFKKIACNSENFYTVFEKNIDWLFHWNFTPNW